MTPRQQLRGRQRARRLHLMHDQMRCWHELIPKLSANAASSCCQVDELEQDELDWLRHYFMDEALAVLTPDRHRPGAPVPVHPQSRHGPGRRARRGRRPSP